MPAAISIDTLRFARRLTDAGMDPPDRSDRIDIALIERALRDAPPVADLALLGALDLRLAREEGGGLRDAPDLPVERIERLRQRVEQGLLDLLQAGERPGREADEGQAGSELVGRRHNGALSGRSRVEGSGHLSTMMVNVSLSLRLIQIKYYL